MKKIVFLALIFSKLTFSLTDDHEINTDKLCLKKDEAFINLKFIELKKYSFFAESLNTSLYASKLKYEFKIDKSIFAVKKSWVNLNLKAKSEVSLGLHANKKLWIFSKVDVEFKKYVHGPKFIFLNTTFQIFK